MHDVGHGFLSHVSERALDRLPTIDGKHTIRELRSQAKKFFGALNPPAIGEVLSGLLILLPEWQEVLSVAQIPFWSDAQDLSLRMAQLICGGRDPRRPFLSEIISGPLDVDKLDYIPRDCYMAGVPMPVDVDRLMEKIQVVTVPADRVPAADDYAEETGIDPSDTVEVLTVQTAGSRAFEELVLSRFLLYEKLYYHQKIRALEGAVVNALEILALEHPAFKEISTYLRLSDDEFLLQHWPPTDARSSRMSVARRIISDVVDRNTFVRCYAFGPSLVKDLDQDSEEFRRKWDSLIPKISASRRQEFADFRARVAERARQFLRWTGQLPLADALADDLIVIDLPPVQGIAEKTKFCVGDEQLGVQLYGQRFRVERWAEAYENQHTLGYVYTSPDFAVPVHFAVRDLIWSENGLSFDDGSWTRTKLDMAALKEFSAEIREKVPAHPVFAEPQLIVERRAFLQRHERKLGIIAKFDSLISEVVERCKTFESYEGTRVGAGTARDWLLQFGDEEIPLAIKVLQSLRFWGRAALSDALAFSVDSRLRENFQALAFGAPTASAHHLAYLWDDVKAKLQRDFRIIAAGSDIKDDIPLVIYDDNVGSGGQAGAILSQWFGVVDSGSDLDEKHVAALPEPVKEKLSQIPVLLVFATGFRSGLDKIIARAKALTQNPNIAGLIIDPGDLSCFRPASRVFTEPQEANRARDAFSRAGKIAIQQKALEKSWSPEKIADRILGYGNSGGLTVFYYNVPTTTITALWSTSRSRGGDWTALFPRRPRLG